MRKKQNNLLNYYSSELAYVRQLSAEFAVNSQVEGARLKIEPDGSSADPHVERLIESFALIAARIHHRIDDEFPEITESLLNILYPHYLNPIPSMSIAQFALDPDQGKMTTGYPVKCPTDLDTRAAGYPRCHFRTCYPVTVWPIEVTSASLSSLGPEDTRGRWRDAFIEINLRCLNDTSLAELESNEEGAEGAARPIESLRFYLYGEPQLVYPLYEMIFNSSTGVELRPAAGSGTGRRREQATHVRGGLRQVGFAEDEGLLPYTRRSFMGYRLLTEYFAFPQKFLFFDVTGLGEAARRGDFDTGFSVRINLENVKPPDGRVSASTFQLGCSPVVNLFKRKADAIDLNRLKNKYRVVADGQRQTYTEVYSVDEVVSDDTRHADERRYEPFYSIRHSDGAADGRTFWYATRRGSYREGDNGTELDISLVDLGFEPSYPTEESLLVRVTATNRDLPGELPLGDFELEGAGPLGPVRCLVRPTKTLRPAPLSGAQWRLISHLSLNYLSIYSKDEAGATDALREILKLYDFSDSTTTRNQILGIKSVTSRLATGMLSAQVGERVGAGFVRGVRTTVNFDERMYVVGGVFLFASVLEHFLRMYASVNSFNQLEARSEQRGRLKLWPVRDSSGEVLAQPFADRDGST